MLERPISTRVFFFIDSKRSLNYNSFYGTQVFVPRIVKLEDILFMTIKRQTAPATDLDPDKSWFPKNRKIRTADFETIAPHLLTPAAKNLAMAHRHRMDDISSEDVSTAFKSMREVRSVPVKTTKDFDGEKLPVVLVDFISHDSSLTLIRVDKMRELARNYV